MTRIVIIDDRVTNRRIMAELATTLEADLEVKAFADPVEALAWVEDHTPDLVITDFKMPNIDGAEFVRRFRRLPFCFDVPVVVVTVYEDREFRYQALEAGATDFLLSPVDHHEFWARSRNLLALRRQQQIIKHRAYSLEQKLAQSHRLHEQTVKEIEGRLRAVIDSVPAMIFATDSDLRLVFLNSYASELCGIAREDAIGAVSERIFGASFGPRSQAGDVAVFATGKDQAPFEERLTDVDGRARVMLATKSALRDINGRVAHTVTVAFDITDRKREETELVEAKESAELANRSKNEFLANMSHELRTPLNAIIGFAEMTAQETLGPIGNARYIEYAGDINRSAQHLLGIINDILDLSKIEAGKMQLDEQFLDVNGVIRHVLRLVEGRARDGDIELETAGEDALPLLRADERKVKQILLNLLSNAIKFTPPGGRVTVGARSVSGDSVELVVKDTGIGMTPQELPVAISRFGQVDGSLSRKYSGTGLGLPLVMSLTELHGGSCIIESVKGAGTTVTVRFPAERSIRRAEAGE
ncbi:MAG TPA: ATP-binding protein [Alphaproteobacteria bacterium]|nr:ATP-binding protein [Alphaproteobacteria bacterium]